MRYQIYNGEFFPEDDFVASSTNRGFNFGDGFFESIRVFDGRSPFLPLHWKRMQFASHHLSLSLENSLTFEQFKHQVLTIAQKNEEPNSRVRFQCFRKGAGKYTPEINEVGWAITSKALEQSRFELNKVGLKIGVCKKVMVNPAPQSSFKSTNAIPYIMGSMEAQAQKLDDCLLLDSRGKIAESTNSNVFLVQGNELITPSLKNGGVNGVMRNIILQTAISLGFKCKFSDFTYDRMLSADELFLTNATTGLKWVAGLEKKRFFKRVSTKLVDAVNEQYQLS